MKLHIDPEVPGVIFDEHRAVVAKIYLSDESIMAPCFGDTTDHSKAVALARQFAASGEMLNCLRSILGHLDRPSNALFSYAVRGEDVARMRRSISAVEGK